MPDIQEAKCLQFTYSGRRLYQYKEDDYLFEFWLLSSFFRITIVYHFDKQLLKSFRSMIIKNSSINDY